MADLLEIAPWMLGPSPEEKLRTRTAERQAFNEEALASHFYTQIRNEAIQNGASEGQANVLAATRSGPLATMFARRTLETISEQNRERLENIKLQNQVRLESGLARFADAASRVDWNSDADRTKLLQIAAQEPIITTSPAFRNIMDNFERADRLREQIQMRHYTSQWTDFQNILKTVDPADAAAISSMSNDPVTGLPTKEKMQALAVATQTKQAKEETDKLALQMDAEQKGLQVTTTMGPKGTTVKVAPDVEAERHKFRTEEIKTKAETLREAGIKAIANRTRQDAFKLKWHAIDKSDLTEPQKAEKYAALEAEFPEIKGGYFLYSAPQGASTPKSTVGSFLEMTDPSGNRVRVPSNRIEELKAKGYKP